MEPSIANARDRFREEAFLYRRTRLAAKMGDVASPVLHGTRPLPQLALQPPFVPSVHGYHVRDLLRFHHSAFIDASFRAILQRSPDAQELQVALRDLADGGSKIGLLAGLRYSPEGRARGVRVDGLRWRSSIERMYRLPVIGRVIEGFAGLLRVPMLVRHHRALEHYATGQIAAVKRLLDETAIVLRSDVELQVSPRITRALAASDASRLELASHAARLASLERLCAELRGVHERITVTQHALHAAVEALRQAVAQADEHAQEATRAIEQHARRTAEQVLELQGTLEQSTASLKVDLDRVVADVEPARVAKIRREARASALDPFYAQLEDAFRGSREEVKARFAVYLPVLRNAQIGAATRPVLDLGCGRGEWLELLREHDLAATGVDRSPAAIAQCRSRGLSVIEEDVVEHVRSLAPASVGAITAMHVVEHLPFEVLVELIDLCVRALQPGGLLILETPNPANVLVGSNTFYLDPTHRKPIPSQLLQFMLRARGMPHAEIMELNPSRHRWTSIESEMDRYLVTHLFGAQDYAVVGHKPSEPDLTPRPVGAPEEGAGS